MAGNDKELAEANEQNKARGFSASCSANHDFRTVAKVIPERA
jgi:hypothetical protein